MYFDQRFYWSSRRFYYHVVDISFSIFKWVCASPGIVSAVYVLAWTTSMGWGLNKEVTTLSLTVAASLLMLIQRSRENISNQEGTVIGSHQSISDDSPLSGQQSSHVAQRSPSSNLRWKHLAWNGYSSYSNSNGISR